MKKVLVRFPNESDYQEITIEIFKFKPEKFFESEIYIEILTLQIQ